MPYIDKQHRDRYETSFVQWVKQMPNIETKGDLEYLITILMKRFMKSREYRYTSLHDCVYAVMHCADEFRRRYLDKREDEAIKENGDIDV